MENRAPFAKPLEQNVISSGFAWELHFVIQCRALVLIAMVWVIIAKVAGSFQTPGSPNFRGAAVRPFCSNQIRHQFLLISC